ncbi:MAG: DNA translocase FtsK 4TM domain-containing protein, partial [Pseudomonadota bacterium]|nr:DNA translocase FtsK 4TM domain-containing protein [Pseudomonadota bacterium]
MAFQTRGGDPLFDSEMQASIERRGKELAGLVLILVGVLAVMLIASYTPDDPSWMSAHDAPVQNWLGRFGASIAAPMYMVIGAGSWGVAVVVLAWGIRLAMHRGEDRAIGRLIFAPIWVALLSVYASTMVPDQDWSHRFGMGGLFGDTVLGATLGIAPVGPSFALKMVSIILAAPVVALGL